MQCSPTRTALHTGQYATRPTNNVYAVSGIAGQPGDPLLGVPHGRPEDGRTAVPVGYPTIGETLQDAGYATGYSGKFHVAGSADEIVASHGFDENWGGSQNSHATYYFATNDQFNDSVSPSLDQFAADYTQDYVDENIAPYSHGVSDARLDALVGTDKHVTDAQTDAAIDFIDRSKDEPFFAFVSEFAPHFPVNDAQARSDLLAKYRAKAPGSAPAKPSYAALTEAVDQSVARIVDYLETTPDPRNGGKPLADNTLVIFTSDNGGEEDPIEAGAYNGPLREDKGFMYEGGVRVPWIVWSGGSDLVRGGGRTNETIVNSTDLYTTLASYAQAELPAGVPLDGVDLKPAFSKGTNDQPRPLPPRPRLRPVRRRGSVATVLERPRRPLEALLRVHRRLLRALRPRDRPRRDHRPRGRPARPGAPPRPEADRLARRDRRAARDAAGRAAAARDRGRQRRDVRRRHDHPTPRRDDHRHRGPAGPVRAAAAVAATPRRARTRASGPVVRVRP